MPRINFPALTLRTVSSSGGSAVTIEISYRGVFSALERFLVDNGLRFQEQIQVIGEDPGTATDRILYTFPVRDITSYVTPGTDPLDIPIPPRTRDFSREFFQEDFGRNWPLQEGTTGDDEISCRITITPIGLPSFVSVLAREVTLPG